MKFHVGLCDKQILHMIPDTFSNRCSLFFIGSSIHISHCEGEDIVRLHQFCDEGQNTFEADVKNDCVVNKTKVNEGTIYTGIPLGGFDKNSSLS